MTRALAWRARDGKLIGCAAGVDRVWVEQTEGIWFWTNMREREWDLSVGRSTAKEAQEAAERWWHKAELSRLAAAGEPEAAPSGTGGL